MKVAPTGIIGFDCDNDLYAQCDRITVEVLQQFGKWIRCLKLIENCVAVVDCPSPLPYTFGGGLVFANFLGANIDLFDLSKPVPPYCVQSELAYHDGMLDKRVNPELFPPLNPEIKVIVDNYSFSGYAPAFFSSQVPTIVVGKAFTTLLEQCTQCSTFMENSVSAANLDRAMKFAKKIAGSENVVVFDGAQGGLNVSPSVRQLLLEKATGVSDEVDKVLLPMWLKQRGISLDLLKA
jgi:hypothetical protein